jgi:hypothetical protein
MLSLNMVLLMKPGTGLQHKGAEGHGNNNTCQ